MGARNVLAMNLVKNQLGTQKSCKRKKGERKIEE
jgi:hypothetical protein